MVGRQAAFFMRRMSSKDWNYNIVVCFFNDGSATISFPAPPFFLLLFLPNIFNSNTLSQENVDASLQNCRNWKYKFGSEQNY